MKTVSFGLLYALSHVTAPSNAETLPSVDDFYRIGLGSVAALGGYVYAEGGELSDKTQQKKKAFSRKLDVTLSVDVTGDWKTEDIKYNEVDRGQKPITKDNTMWADEENNRLYQWDGGGPWGSKGGADDRQLWAFDPDGKGGGEWSVAEVSDPAALSNSTRPGMAAATVCGGKGFIIGGWQNRLTDARSEVDPSIPVPGMVSFDFATKEWKNISEPMMPGTKNDNGAFVRGQAVCVKGFGDTEYILPIGGVSSGLDSFERTDENWSMMSMETLSLYDVKEEKWIQQGTTGDPKVPEARTDHCAAGAPSGNGTYEVFVYGGRTQDKKALSDVWVLTIPGFHWVQADVRAERRFYHECTLAGNRGREVLVFGGYTEKSWFSKDEFTYGMGVWDMSKMDFAYEYGGNSGRGYEPPLKVQKWYREGGLKKVDWNSDEVEKVFNNRDGAKDGGGKSTTQNKGANEGKEEETAADKEVNDEESEKEVDKQDDITDPANTSDPSSDDGNSDGAQDGEDARNADSSSTPVGAIVGGVIGGVALLAAIAFMIWLIRHRNRNHSSSPSHSVAEKYQHCQASPRLAEAQYGSLHGQHVHHVEKDGNNLKVPRAELGDEVRAELEGSQYPRIGSHPKSGWMY